MIVNLIQGEDVTIRRDVFFDGEVDEYGVEVASKYEEVIKDTIVNYVYTTESKTVEEQASNTQVILYFPAGTTILPNDTFIVRGSLWQLDGLDFQWKNQFTIPTILNIRVEVPIRQVKGNTDA